MLRLEPWVDFFKFNKELLDDDYNKDQAFVAKGKSKSADGTTVIDLTVSVTEHIGIHNYLQASAP
jgi:hypothetical protein